ncbi:MAG TPA: DNA alkylation repair protein [Rhodocyclaceae bacterium]
MKRKTYNARAAIPADLQAALDSGREEPLTLAEWLAVDYRKLLAAALPGAGLGQAVDQLIAVADSADGVMARQRAIGAALLPLIRAAAEPQSCYECVAAHASGVVREWAALCWTADPGYDLATRLTGARRFAADPSMNVREIAWSSFRPWLAEDLDNAVALLAPWTRDADPNIRRCAIEATRPRGVWCVHIDALKQTPQLALPLLEAVRSDTSRYVQLSVANWLNDVSKHQPDWVRQTTARWLAESPTSETRWIVHHALRTLRKQGVENARTR